MLITFLLVVCSFVLCIYGGAMMLTRCFGRRRMGALVGIAVTALLVACAPAATPSAQSVTPPFQVFVKGDTTMVVDLCPRLLLASITVEDAKLAIWNETNIPPSEQRLLFAGKQLEDGHGALG